MRDAIGGVVSIQLILVFIAVVSGYLAFSVSYTKAVHVKDFIINKIEEYEEPPTNGNTAEKDIEIYMNKIGYRGIDRQNFSSDSYCSDYFTAGSTSQSNPELVSTGNEAKYVICKLKGGDTSGNNAGDDPIERNYYGVVTYITIDIPIVRNIMSSFTFFGISGKTRLIEEH